MAKYTNRGGRTVDLDPNKPDTIARVDAGELTPIAAVPKEEIVGEDTPGPDKKELTAKYIAKFDKKPFAGWNAEKLQEKLNQ